MSKVLVCALHGFLGHGSDWKEMSEEIKTQFNENEVQFWSPNLLTNDSQLNPSLDFTSWSNEFIKEVEGFGAEKNILMGYSLGGRLGFHSLIEHPKVFDAAIFLSTNSIRLKPEEADKRKVSDLEWSKKFISLDWSTLVNEWNSLPIFDFEKVHPERKESDYSRKFLAQALTNWSLSNHKYGMEEFKSLEIPSYWIVGKNDHKFVAIMEIVKKSCPNANYEVLEEYGHRIGLQRDEGLALLISDFIKAILPT